MSLPRPWVLLLFGSEFASTNQKHYPGWGSDARERRVISIEVHRISALVPQMSIRGETSGNFGKCWLFFFRLFNVKKKNFDTQLEYVDLRDCVKQAKK